MGGAAWRPRVMASLLLAGKPRLIPPLNLERLLAAKRVADFGAGPSAPQPQAMETTFRRLITEEMLPGKHGLLRRVIMISGHRPYPSGLLN